MKEDVERPNELVDLTPLKLTEIKESRGGVSIGAPAKNSETANHPLIRQNYPLLTQAIVAGASGQLRNMATNGGNLIMANKDATSPFKAAKLEDVEMLDGKLQSKNSPSQSVGISELLRRNNLTEIVDTHESKPSPEREKYATSAHGAQFIEVKVDPDVGTVRVARGIEVSACGKIMNPKTSHSQEFGGIVWGIGMALQEATEVDHRYGRNMNPNLQHYHVPVNADILDVETIFVEEDDRIVNPLGIKGMGELGMVGIPVAIANAVFHATGRRIRELPITPDKLL